MPHEARDRQDRKFRHPYEYCPYLFALKAQAVGLLWGREICIGFRSGCGVSRSKGCGVQAGLSARLACWAISNSRQAGRDYVPDWLRD